jgi:DNA-binding CsgD family transcriptional regulator
MTAAPAALSRQEHERVMFGATAAAGLTLVRELADGRSQTELARQYGETVDWVKTRLKALYAMLGVANLPHALAVLVLAGHVTREDLERAARRRVTR